MFLMKTQRLLLLMGKTEKERRDVEKGRRFKAPQGRLMKTRK
jgi:hypothetical protein